MPEYPEFAWQEAIVNAVAHRDYNDQGREIEVWFFDNRMEVLSPGDLVPPVTLEELQRRSPSHASRNPLLVRALAQVGIMRDEGEGIPRIFEEMEESLLKQPEITVEASQFSVVLRNEQRHPDPRGMAGRGGEFGPGSYPEADFTGAAGRVHQRRLPAYQRYE